MLARDAATAPGRETARRFYRPELDALRFCAFLAVLVHHGPGSSGLPNFIRGVGGFGLSMFFLLSAYLITELLLRERGQSGTIAWGRFFIRRALRIWPLYYAALTVGIVFALVGPHRLPVSLSGIGALCFFIANGSTLTAHLGPLLFQLWSLSIEEQFYLIWPPIVKAGGKRLAFAASIFFVVFAGVWLWIFSGEGWKLWFDTPVEFLFFAAGAIVALVTHGESVHRMGRLIRGCLLIAGLVSLAFAAQVGGIGTANAQGLTIARLYIGYFAALAGCSAIFSAVLGTSKAPRGLIYLGKISYGLYVFHGGVLALSMWMVLPLKLAPASTLNMVIVDSLALLLCIPAAQLSYRYFEAPFLRLKERFEVIKSRRA
jgi:peptidoglycan/LPS O-acetylase OafA/YrhL